MGVNYLPPRMRVESRINSHFFVKSVAKLDKFEETATFFHNFFQDFFRKRFHKDDEFENFERCDDELRQLNGDIHGRKGNKDDTDDTDANHCRPAG